MDQFKKNLNAKAKDQAVTQEVSSEGEALATNQRKAKGGFIRFGNLKSEFIPQADVSKNKLCMCGNGIIIGVVFLL